MPFHGAGGRTGGATAETYTSFVSSIRQHHPGHPQRRPGTRAGAAALPSLQHPAYAKVKMDLRCVGLRPGFLRLVLRVVLHTVLRVVVGSLLVVVGSPPRFMASCVCIVEGSCVFCMLPVGSVLARGDGFFPSFCKPRWLRQLGTNSRHGLCSTSAHRSAILLLFVCSPGTLVPRRSASPRRCWRRRGAGGRTARRAE